MPSVTSVRLQRRSGGSWKHFHFIKLSGAWLILLLQRTPALQLVVCAAEAGAPARIDP